MRAATTLTAAVLAIVSTLGLDQARTHAANGTLHASTLTFSGSSTASMSFKVRTDIAAGADGTSVLVEFAQDGNNRPLNAEPFPTSASVTFTLSYNGTAVPGFACTAQQAVNGCSSTNSDPAILFTKQSNTFGRYSLTISYPSGSSSFTAGWSLGVNGLPTSPHAIRGTGAITNGTFQAPLVPAGATDVFPSSAIMFFNLSSCPSGWSAVPAAEGRYLVGVPSPGTLGATVGTALSNIENRPVGLHFHQYSDTGHSHGITDPGHAHGVGAGTRYVFWDTGTCKAPTHYGSFTNPDANCLDWATTNATSTTNINGTGTATTNISIQNAGSVSGTSAPYVQYRVCQKN